MTTIRALHSSDDRSRFDCGDVDLDRFFAKYAGQNQFKHHIGTTYVAVNDAGGVIGYATVSPASIEVDELPGAAMKRLPAYPIPVLRLARLAVDRSVQRQGVGRALLRYVLDLALRMADDYGCVGVVVDAKSAAVAFYEGYGFIAVDLLEGESSARPQPTAMFLSVKDIRAAAR